MSKINLTPNASGTGVFTIASPNSNTDYTINLPEISGGEFVATDASGNVGIGTDSPTNFGAGFTTLDIRDSTAGILKLGFDSQSSFGSRIQAQNDNGLKIINTEPSAFISFTTVSSERMRIDSSGNLLVGTTSNTNSFRQVLNYDGGALSGLEFQDQSGSSTRTAIRFNRNATTQVGSVTLGTSSTAYNTTSDYRLKENVVDLDNGIDRLKQIPVHRFNFLADPDTVVDGFIAHEVQDVVPEAITGTKDAVDAEGNPEYQGIDQSKLVPLLTAALQEAITKIEDLESRLSAVEAN